MSIHRLIFTDDKKARADKAVFFITVTIGVLAIALAPWGVA